MQDPKDNQPSTKKSILVGISVMIIGTIAIYFLKFFGLTLKAILQKSISQASNSELYTNLLLILIICLFGLSAFIVSLLFWRKKEIKDITDKQPDEERKTDIKQSFEEQLNNEILFHILQIKSFNQLATPRTLASAIDSKPEIILDRLNKLHNDQYVTFQTGGNPPTLDTDFFLSPKAFDVLKIDNIHPPESSTFIHYNDLLWLHNDPVPFCRRCSESDKKNIHMFVKIKGNPPRYKCPECGYYPNPSKHPDDPEDPPSPKPKQPLFMTRSGWVTKWKDQ